MLHGPVKIARRVWLHTQCNFLFNCLGGAPCPILTANKETLNIIGTRDQNCNGRVIKERRDKRITVANPCFRDWQQW